MGYYNLSGKVVLVTGAETGIGRAIALRAAADGACVTAAGINREGLDETVKLAREAGAGERFLDLDVDVRDPAQVQKMVDDTVAEFGRLDAAVANAGVMIQRRPFVESTHEEWHHVLSVNLHGTFHTLQAVTRVLRRQGEGGDLLVTTSSNAVRPGPQASSYVASKGAIHQMVRALAVELAPEKIRVNAIVPGLTLTPGTINRPGHIERGLPGVPMGEITMPEEIAALVAFALSGEAPHMTGTDLKIDGGRTSA
jgi:NAD(P)-dependent dehydrogenase (short-subunit alcohol dehydrogenase family)